MVGSKRLVIIVLNYMNYQDTNECVCSILKQEYENYHVLIVDNASSNESYGYLKKAYRNHMLVSVIKAKKNYGFAKGNNIGIHYAREKLGAEYIMLLNNDTVLDDPLYLKKMIASDELKVGVIGSKIRQSKNRNMKKIYRYVRFPATLVYYLKLFCKKMRFNGIQQIFECKLMEYQGDYILHGCVLLLTPAYFQNYDDLDARTFLYCEEELLYIRCLRAGLQEKLVNEISIFHKGGQSSEILYSNNSDVYNKYLLSSYKFVLLESVKDVICKIKNRVL